MVQKIPAPLEKVWELFSNSANLVQLTPAGMDIHILSDPEDQKIYTGQIIRYRLKPLWGIPVHWVTEINEVEEGKFFSDTQQKGPYRVWEHHHYFKPIDGGVEMRDIVHYKIPWGLLGRIANTVVVRKKLRQVFSYRYAQIEKLFGKWEGQQCNIEIS